MGDPLPRPSFKELYAAPYRAARNEYLFAAKNFDDADKLYKITSAALTAYLASTQE